jgi:hypothetical protein
MVHVRWWPVPVPGERSEMAPAPQCRPGTHPLCIASRGARNRPNLETQGVYLLPDSFEAPAP